MAVIKGFVPNKLDTPAQRRFAFPGPEILGLTGLIRRNINIPYFEAARQSRYDHNAVVEVYAQGRCLIEGWESLKYARPLAACELASSCLPDDFFAAEAVARKYFVKGCARYLCQRRTWVSNYSFGNDGAVFTGATEAVNTILARVPTTQPPEDADTLVKIMIGLQNSEQITDAHYSRDVAEAMAWLVDLLVSRSTARSRSCQVNHFTIVYVALNKLGNMTSNRMASVNQSISLKTGLEVDVTIEEIETANRALRIHVGEHKAREIMESLSVNMNKFSLGLSLVVDLTIRAGLAQYWAIILAINYFPTFPWGEASRYIPNDFIKFRTAVEIVGNNEYYGFSHNLRPVSHTHYKSLAWLCAKLLIKLKGEEFGLLANYRALVRVPDRERELQTLIDHFINPPAVEVVADIAELTTRAIGLMQGG